jgi:Holliday junction resolvase RusA-like endonuclease
MGVFMYKVIDLQKIKLRSVNKKYINRNFKLSPEYSSFKELMYYSIDKPKEKILKPYTVAILMKTYIDIDNPIKAILDALADRKLIVNDRKVLRLLVDKIEEKRGYPSNLEVYLGTLGDRNDFRIPFY